MTGPSRRGGLVGVMGLSGKCLVLWIYSCGSDSMNLAQLALIMRADL